MTRLAVLPADIPFQRLARAADTWQLTDEPAIPQQSQRPSRRALSSSSCRACGDLVVRIVACRSLGR